MLTVKHITPRNHECIYMAERVLFQPEILSDTDDAAPATVWHTDKAGQTHPITDGSVYIMNDAGSTVAKYSLAYPTSSESPESQKPAR